MPTGVGMLEERKVSSHELSQLVLQQCPWA